MMMMWNTLLKASSVMIEKHILVYIQYTHRSIYLHIIYGIYVYT